MLLAHQRRVDTVTVRRMAQFGGRFERYIAEAWFVADAQNRQKLEETFAEEFAKFE